MTRVRRALIASFALVIAFAMFHTQLAAAVVTRGDDVLRTGNVPDALRLYQRAMVLDPRSAVAADRMAFYLGMRHDAAGANAAIAVVTRALQRGAWDPALFADRAFAELRLHAWRDAEHDFAAAGNAAHDARYHHFAARMALYSADRPAAVRYTRLALDDDPHFAPAQAFMRTFR